MSEPARRVGVTVAVDFDGVLHQKDAQFSGDVTGDAVPGAAEGVERALLRTSVDPSVQR
jgi:hypothetical protein